MSPPELVEGSAILLDGEISHHGSPALGIWGHAALRGPGPTAVESHLQKCRGVGWSRPPVDNAENWGTGEELAERSGGGTPRRANVRAQFGDSVAMPSAHRQHRSANPAGGARVVFRAEEC